MCVAFQQACIPHLSFKSLNQVFDPLIDRFHHWLEVPWFISVPRPFWRGHPLLLPSCSRSTAQVTASIYL
jgi:hypothetical protein